MAATARVERTPTHHDREVAGLLRRAIAVVDGTGRFGDRKVFVSAVWTTMCRLDTAGGGTLTEGCTIDHFKGWLFRSRILTTDGSDNGAPLVVLARADLVAAMDPALVATSEVLADGATYHFVLDPVIAVDLYVPRLPARAPFLPSARARVSVGRERSRRTR